MSKGKLYDKFKETLPYYPYYKIEEILDETKKELQPWWGEANQLENGVSPYEILGDIERWFKAWFGGDD